MDMPFPLLLTFVSSDCFQMLEHRTQVLRFDPDATWAAVKFEPPDGVFDYADKSWSVRCVGKEADTCSNLNVSSSAVALRVSFMCPPQIWEESKKQGALHVAASISGIR